jgi:hypothetical protein
MQEPEHSRGQDPLRRGAGKDRPGTEDIPGPGVRCNPGERMPDIRAVDVLPRLVACYHAPGRPDEAIPWEQRLQAIRATHLPSAPATQSAK